MTLFVFRNKKFKRFDSLIYVLEPAKWTIMFPKISTASVDTIFFIFNTDSNVDHSIIIGAGSCSSNDKPVNQSLWSSMLWILLFCISLFLSISSFEYNWLASGTHDFIYKIKTRFEEPDDLFEPFVIVMWFVCCMIDVISLCDADISLLVRTSELLEPDEICRSGHP